MSNEWLTTGKMIDRLKVGEVAECVNPPEKWLSTKQKRVVKKDNVFLWQDGVDFRITTFMSDEAKWRILPNYVDFETAMKALGEGKEIYFHGGNTLLGKPIKYPGGVARNMNGTKFTNYSLHTLFHGKWTIEDDTP